MKIGFGWTASFIDGSRLIVCQKAGNPARRIAYKFTAGARSLKRVDLKTGLAVTDSFNMIPPEPLAAIKKAARDRWG